jgi:hypothetical protein
MPPALGIYLHVMIFTIGIICYTVLTVLGHDGNPVLAATLGYGGGAVVENKTSQKNSN